jgi:FKBP-type peptidyl-prolyl cis-trans isomerase FklB
MKKSIIVIVFLCVSASLLAQNNQPKSDSQARVNPIRSTEDSVQYALGIYMAEYLLRGGFTSLNLNFFLSGLNDRYKNAPRLLPDSLIYPLIAAYQNNAQTKRAKDLEKELFELIKDKPGIGKLPSGVQYTIIQPSKGPKPQETDTVLIHYKGTLPDGRVFENTFVSNTPVITTPATLIPGLNEVLQLMAVGSRWQVFIPASMAYAEKGNNQIPPNSALLILVELLEIRGKK